MRKPLQLRAEVARKRYRKAVEQRQVKCKQRLTKVSRPLILSAVMKDGSTDVVIARQGQWRLQGRRLQGHKTPIVGIKTVPTILKKRA